MDKQITACGTTMHYTDTGTGSNTVVLMHGWGCTCETVESIRLIAVSAGYRVLTVDFPGHGKSPEPPELADGTVWGVEQYTQLIEQLVKSEGIESPTLIGHSFGGRVAILYGSRNRTARIVLVDAAGVKPKRPLSYYYKVYSFKTAKWFLLTFLGKKRGNERIEAMRAKRGSADYNSASPMMRRILSKVVNEDLCHVMPLVKAPTLLMWGEEDTATPVSDARKMEKLIPDAGIVTFPHCGHYSFLDNPRAFSTVLSNFLDLSR